MIVNSAKWTAYNEAELIILLLVKVVPMAMIIRSALASATFFIEVFLISVDSYLS